jgi:hypothetical protein
MMSGRVWVSSAAEAAGSIGLARALLSLPLRVMPPTTLGWLV